MAGLTKEQRAQREEEKQIDGLVLMEKNGEQIRVHPSCVKAHEQVGWRMIDSDGNR